MSCISFSAHVFFIDLVLLEWIYLEQSVLSVSSFPEKISGKTPSSFS